MKRFVFSLPRFSPLHDTRFWDNCSRDRWGLLLMSVLLLVGIVGGPWIALSLNLFQNREVLPLFFSGIPEVGAGFLSVFTTLLLNLLIFLTLSFLFGVTAFGCFIIPFLMFFRGMTVGLGVVSFLLADGLFGFARSALSYTPVAAASLLLFILFSLRALVFSNCLRQVSFTSREGTLDFRDYCNDYLRFLCFAVAVSIVGSGLTMLGQVFFP